MAAENRHRYLSRYLFIAVFSNAATGKQKRARFSETPLTVCIADKDHSPLSEQLTAYLQTKHRVTLLDGFGLSDEALLKKLRKNISVGTVDAGLIISEGFEQKTELGQKGIISIKDGRQAAAFYIDSQIQTFLRFALSTKEATGAFRL